MILSAFFCFRFAGSGYPEGIDPSFLEALPENMRQEVIADFMRMQRLQRQTQERETRAAAAPSADGAATGAAAAAGSSSSAATAASSAFDINPEFLAALPPNIQEEVRGIPIYSMSSRIASID